VKRVSVFLCAAMLLVCLATRVAVTEDETSLANSATVGDLGSAGLVIAPKVSTAEPGPGRRATGWFRDAMGLGSPELIAEGFEDYAPDGTADVMSGAVCSEGEVVFGQLVDDPGPGWSAALSDQSTDYIVVDNFESAGWITAVQIWGFRADAGGGWNPCDEDPMPLGVAFFEDDGGMPGTMLADFYHDITAWHTGVMYGMYELFSYTIILDTPVFIEDGFVSVKGMGGDPDCHLVWMSGDGLDGHCLHWDGSSFNDRWYDQAFCLLTAGCPIYTYYSQPPHMPNDAVSGFTSDTGPVEQWKVYDDFSLSDPPMGIRFWGFRAHLDGSWSECTEDPMAFEISFYLDDGGLPGPEIASYTEILTARPTQLKYLSGMFEAFEYEAFFDPVKLLDGWVSVQGIGDPACWFMWISTRQAHDGSCLQWDGSTYQVRSVDMAFCILDDAPCCGLYTGGYTGNTNCDNLGKRNLSDITTLIDRVYVTGGTLCCEENGNTNGDIDGKINLSDITVLVDHVYVTLSPTAVCP